MSALDANGGGAALNGAHASRITVCGRAWRVRRELELAQRIEERFGAIAPLLARLRGADVPIAGLAALLAEILSGQQGAPKESELAQLIFEEGCLVAVEACQEVVASLLTGAETLAALDAGDDAPPGEPIMDPRAASSDGPG